MYETYRTKLSELKRLQREQLQLNESQMEQLVKEKSKIINQLSKEIEKYRHEHLSRVNKQAPDNQLVASDICRELHEKATIKVTEGVTDKDWDKLQNLFNELLPRFYSVVNANHAVLKKDEYIICMLVRMHFEAYEICNLLGESSSNVSMKRARLAQKIFGEKMSPKEFDKRIHSINIT
jgi:hypothetical protein